MRFTRIPELAATMVIAGLVINLLTQALYGSWPGLPLLAGTPLLLLAIVETVLGFSIRARIARRPGASPVEPLTTARAVVLAKATSVTGAVMLGGWLGVAGYLLPRLGEIVAAEADMTAAIVGAVSAAGAVGAGLWLEHCCRTPDDSDEDRRGDDPAVG